jgi:hypothetical protein
MAQLQHLLLHSRSYADRLNVRRRICAACKRPEGRVMDPFGAVIPGASVRVEPYPG